MQNTHADSREDGTDQDKRSKKQKVLRSIQANKLKVLQKVQFAKTAHIQSLRNLTTNASSQGPTGAGLSSIFLIMRVLLANLGLPTKKREVHNTDLKDRDRYKKM